MILAFVVSVSVGSALAADPVVAHVSRLQCTYDHRAADGPLNTFALEVQANGKYRTTLTTSGYSMVERREVATTKVLAEDLDCTFSTVDPLLFACQFETTAAPFYSYSDVAKSQRQLSLDPIWGRTDDALKIEGMTNLKTDKVERLDLDTYNYRDCSVQQ